MKNPFRSLLQRLWSGVVPALLACALATPALAVGPGGNNQGSSDPQTNASSPGDDVTSLPFTGPTGTTLVGSPRALRSLVLDVEGRGGLFVQRLAPGRIAATLTGNLRVTLDREVLARGEVLVLYHGAAEEGGILTLLDQAPQLVDCQRLPLPLARLAQGTRATQWLELQAFTDRRATHLDISADRRSVVLTQFVREL